MPPRPSRTARRRPAKKRPPHEAARLVLDGVRRLDRGLRLAARKVERDTGLSAAQLFVLHHLNEAPATSLNELAARTYTDRSSVSAVVDRLEKARLVRRTAARHDRRQLEVRITARGMRTLSVAPPAPTDILLDGIAKLSRASTARLGKALVALNTALGFEDAELLFNPD